MAGGALVAQAVAAASADAASAVNPQSRTPRRLATLDWSFASRERTFNLHPQSWSTSPSAARADNDLRQARSGPEPMTAKVPQLGVPQECTAQECTEGRAEGRGQPRSIKSTEFCYFRLRLVGGTCCVADWRPGLTGSERAYASGRQSRPTHRAKLQKLFLRIMSAARWSVLTAVQIISNTVGSIWSPWHSSFPQQLTKELAPVTRLDEALCGASWQHGTTPAIDRIWS